MPYFRKIILSSVIVEFKGGMDGFKLKYEGTNDPEYKSIMAIEMLGLREGFIMAINNITFVIMWFGFIPIILLPFCKVINGKATDTFSK